MSIGKGMFVWLLDGMYLENERDQPFGVSHIGLVFLKLFSQEALFE
jgi:hypothetical protein